MGTLIGEYVSLALSGLKLLASPPGLPTAGLRTRLLAAIEGLEKSSQAFSLNRELTTPKHSRWIPPNDFKIPCWEP